MTINKITGALLLLAVPCIAIAQKTWTPVKEEISFRIKNAGLHVNGHFDGGRSELIFSADKLVTSKLKETIQVASIKTGIGLRDKHLKSDRFFDADSFKTITVESTKLYIKNTDYAGMFNVTVKGITKEMEIPFQFNQFADEAEFKGSFTVKRSDFGVGEKSKTMADDVEITVLIKAREAH